MICERCNCVFCDDYADERPQDAPKRFCGRNCQKRAMAAGKPACHGKKRYPDASAAMGDASKVFQSEGWQLYPYECKPCGAWHLTSELPELFEKVVAVKRALFGSAPPS